MGDQQGRRRYLYALCPEKVYRAAGELVGWLYLRKMIWSIPAGAEKAWRRRSYGTVLNS